MMTHKDGKGPDSLRRQSELKPAVCSFAEKGMKDKIQDDFNPFPYPAVLREAREKGGFWAVATIRLHLTDDFKIDSDEFPENVVIRAALAEVSEGHDPDAFDDISRYLFGPYGIDSDLVDVSNDIGPEGFAALMPYLVKGLKSPSEESREMASRLISACCYYHGPPSETEMLAGPLKDALMDVSTIVRRESAFSLGLLGDKSAVPRLIECLRDPDPDVRNNASEALGLLKDPMAVPFLLELLHDSDIQLVSDVLQALGNIGDGRAIGPLKQYMLKDLDIKDEAEEALRKLGVPEEELRTLGVPRSYRRKD